MNVKNEKSKFYYIHTEYNCQIFCISCNKIAYSTEHNKYWNNEECLGHDHKLQCLNSSCPNGFSKTYHKNYVPDNRSETVKRKGVKITNRVVYLPQSSTNYMTRFDLQR